MIRYHLRCERGHAFESWFQNSGAYYSQVKRKLVNCPSGLSQGGKAIMAPQIARKKKNVAAPQPQPPGDDLDRSQHRAVDAAHDGAGARVARQATPPANSAPRCLLTATFRAAEEQFKRALQLDPKYTDARYNLASVEANAEDWPKAAADFKKVLEGNPNHQNARQHLGEVLFCGATT